MSKPLDNLCLTVALPPQPTNDGLGLYPHQTLLDMIKTVDLSQIIADAGKIQPMSFKPDYRKPSWSKVVDQQQAKMRLMRTQHMAPTLFIDPADRTFDLKAMDVMRKKYDEAINKAMFGSASMIDYLRMDPRERRPYPDFEEGFLEGLRNDVSRGLGFGEVVTDQMQYEAEEIRRWIWGPHGEFTGFPAGDRAFEDTYDHMIRRERGGGVCKLMEFEKTIDVYFRFTERCTRKDMARDPYGRAAWEYQESRGRPGYMIQFATYEGQYRWATLARRAATEMMNTHGMERDRGY